MLKVGITGNIGSGKTTICKIFEALSIPIYYADDRAKQLVLTDEILKKEIINLLGEAAYTASGAYNRKYVASIVFNDAEKLKALNALVHPAVRDDGINWQSFQKNNGALYTIKEAALLYEAGSYKDLDKMICVVAPEALRLQRVMQRDNVTAESVQARMNKQWPQEKKARMSDFLIYNDGTQSLIKQVLRLHHRFIAISNSST